MKNQDIAVKLFEALQDGKRCAVEVQPITSTRGDREDFYLRIDGKRTKVSKKLAVNAIHWGLYVNTLERQYQFL
jgi:hypothetical protein